METNIRIDPLNLPGKTRTIVFSFDDKYAKYFSVVLTSLKLHRETDCRYEIIILHDSLSDQTMERLMRIAPDGFILRFFNVGGCFHALFGDLPEELTSGNWNIATFYDLLVPILMPGYERALYCDADILFCADPGELFEMPFEGRELIAVKDSFTLAYILNPGNSFFVMQEPFVRTTLGISDFRQYFNSGVILFNIPSIDREIYLQKVRRALAFPTLPTVDQDVLNYVFRDSVLLAPQRFNLQASVMTLVRKRKSAAEAEDYLEAAGAPVVIHYTTADKPWKNPDCPMGKEFWKYARRSPYFAELRRDTMSLLREKEKLSLAVYFGARLLSAISWGKRRKHFVKVRKKHVRIYRFWKMLWFGERWKGG